MHTPILIPAELISKVRRKMLILFKLLAKILYIIIYARLGVKNG